MKATNKENFSNLIDEILKIPQTPHNQKEKNFFSICNISKKETVASSVLAFFFDTTEEHGFGDLFASSLIEAAKFKDVYSGTFEAETEVITDDGKRIDILLNGEDVNIAIENKIDAALTNDLKSYLKYAEKDVAKAKVVVLSLNEVPTDNEERRLCESGEDKDKFAFITYGDFIPILKQKLGLYLQNENPRYIPLLMEFINNIESLNEEKSSMNEELMEFAIEKAEELEKCTKILKQIYDALEGKTKKVFDILQKEFPESEKEIRLYKYNPKQKNFRCVGADCTMGDSIVALDVLLFPSGWYFVLFSRNGNGLGKGITEKLGKEDEDFELIKEGSDLFTKDNDLKNRYCINPTEEFLLNTSESDVAEYVLSLIKKIFKQPTATYVDGNIK